MLNVGVDRYVELIVSLARGIRTIFIASDSGIVFREISELIPDYKCISLTEGNAKGYIHSEFKSLPAAERRRRTLRFFVQLELMRDANLFLGSKTTNVSWIVNAFRGGRE